MYICVLFYFLKQLTCEILGKIFLLKIISTVWNCRKLGKGLFGKFYSNIKKTQERAVNKRLRLKVWSVIVESSGPGSPGVSIVAVWGDRSFLSALTGRRRNVTLCRWVVLVQLGNCMEHCIPWEGDNLPHLLSRYPNLAILSWQAGRGWQCPHRWSCPSHFTRNSWFTRENSIHFSNIPLLGVVRASYK